jgi:hypothetical protein
VKFCQVPAAHFIPMMLEFTNDNDGYWGIKPVVLDVTESIGETAFTTSHDEK